MSNGIRKWPNENKETSASRTEGTLITQTHTISCTAKPINIQTFSFTQTSCVHTKSCVFFLIKSLTFSRSWFNPELSSMVIPQERRGEDESTYVFSPPVPPVLPPARTKPSLLPVHRCAGMDLWPGPQPQKTEFSIVIITTTTNLTIIILNPNSNDHKDAVLHHHPQSQYREVRMSSPSEPIQRGTYVITLRANTELMMMQILITIESNW